MKRSAGVVGSLLAAAAIALLLPAFAAPRTATAPLLVKSGNLARDCIGDVMLDPARRNGVRFVVWCSVQSGEARFSLRRASTRRSPAAPIEAVSASPTTTGPGAERAFRCRLQVRSVRCDGGKAGPVVIRGRISVPAGTRCAPVSLDTAQAGFTSRPLGCPGSRPWRPRFRVAEMRRQRRMWSFDEDLNGDRAAIDRRIRGIIRAWHRGEPVARVTATEMGLPMRAADARRLEFRDELLERTTDALERWAPRHAPDNYAGYWLDDSGDVTMYVGFTGDQEAWLAAFKRSFDLFAPDHIKPYPEQPRYSERRLLRYEEEVIESLDSPLARLITSVGTAVGPINKVHIGTRHVAKVKRLLIEKFGTDDPFLVVFEGPGVLL